MTRSARAPTSAGCSPFGHPSRNKSQPGRPPRGFAALAPFVVAVVPFDQVGVQLGGLAEPSQRAGARRTLKRTGEDPTKSQSLKTLAERSRFSFALLSEGNIRATRFACRLRSIRFHHDGRDRRKEAWQLQFATSRARGAEMTISYLYRANLNIGEWTALKRMGERCGVRLINSPSSDQSAGGRPFPSSSTVGSQAARRPSRKFLKV